MQCSQCSQCSLTSNNFDHYSAFDRLIGVRTGSARIHRPEASDEPNSAATDRLKPYFPAGDDVIWLCTCLFRAASHSSQLDGFHSAFNYGWDPRDIPVGPEAAEETGQWALVHECRELRGSIQTSWGGRVRVEMPNRRLCKRSNLKLTVHAKQSTCTICFCIFFLPGLCSGP